MSRQIIPDVTNISHIRQHTASFFRDVAGSQSPKWVSIDSRIEAVVLSPKAYEKLVKDAERASQLIDLVAEGDVDYLPMTEMQREDDKVKPKEWKTIRKSLQSKLK